ncbi:MAG: NADH-quinone oxidoreductase subunit NuoE [Deltaproteobacteria bacterium HGW-Deltaproteobacteria-15]|jgi:NADH-quinone oxidoreductase subunit E|nr:MAG: NADH-quinone oxidoreductase subunit NuoE [Deltaproteobacteria bacterium HGW-Deltaproteobacteria-15]
MLPLKLKERLIREIAEAETPREKVVDVMLALQKNYGYMSDQAVEDAAALLGMTPLEVEELATFYDFIYREPVGRYVIRVCDSTVCWMQGHLSLVDHIGSRLGIEMGGTTPDGLFTLLPVCCIGYCDFAPAIMVNDEVYGNLTTQKIDELLRRFSEQDRLPKG